MHELGESRLSSERREGVERSPTHIRGTGSARERAMAIDGIYGVAAPIPGVTGDPHSTTLVASIKALAQEAVEEAGGEFE